MTVAHVPQGEEDRFGFGENWRRFLEHVDEERIREAMRSIAGLLGEDGVVGRRVLDVGCGSGLFSLAALRLGAACVRSFDYDADSVDCTAEMRRRFGPADADWTVEHGDATDRATFERLGTFDVVYAWGVLHHTGAMWTALEETSRAVSPDGRLVLSIYNDQGLTSRWWSLVKRTYRRVPVAQRPLYVAVVMLPRELRFLAGSLAARRPREYVHSWTRYRTNRGMSRWHDLVDWVGGYPFEVARPDQIFTFFRDRGFALEDMTTAGGGLGCNEFVFRRREPESAPATQPDEDDL